MLFVVLASALSVCSAHAEDDNERASFIVNNITHILFHEAGHVLFHEAGHAVIDQFELPVIGQEEDAADSFATVEVLELYEDPYFILLDSAEANFLMQEDVDLEDQQNYFGVHDLDVQRGYRIVCMAVGTDRDKYGDIADWAQLPEGRQESCVDDADMAIDSWASFREQIARDLDAPAASISISYEDHGKFEAEYALLKDNEVMEDFRDYLTSEFAWPSTMSLSVEQCDEANAFYDPASVSIVMCYEMVAFMAELEQRR